MNNYLNEAGINVTAGSTGLIDNCKRRQSAAGNAAAEAHSPEDQGQDRRCKARTGSCYKLTGQMAGRHAPCFTPRSPPEAYACRPP